MASTFQESTKFRQLLDGKVDKVFDLESIQLKLSSDHSLTIWFSRSFPNIDGLSFSPYKPYKMAIFETSVTCTFLQELYLQIDKNSAEKV